MNLMNQLGHHIDIYEPRVLLHEVQRSARSVNPPLNHNNAEFPTNFQAFFYIHQKCKMGI